MTNQTFPITDTTRLAAPCWLWHPGDKKWVDTADLGGGALYAPHAFGFTHWREKPKAEDVIREAVKWVTNRLAVEGHPCPENFVTTRLWMEAISPPHHGP